MQNKSLVLFVTHVVALGIGFAVGIYTLPILTAPPGPSADGLGQVAANARYSGEFRRDLAGSDFLHWGEGRLSLSDEAIILQGELAPGPDYRLYLSPEFVETEAQFERHKSAMIEIGDIKTFTNFSVALKPEVDLAKFSAVIVWCESFGEFITAAKYQ
ncbi:MAG: DM13 domain-containing protein [Gammaproteobacteria bacterium]